MPMSNTIRGKNFKFLKVSFALFTLTTLSACLITSPYYDQTFSSRSDAIPFTVYTADGNTPITIECAQANAHRHRLSSRPYQEVATVQPATQGILDPSAGKIYSASTALVLPTECYRNYPQFSDDDYDWITVVRVSQEGSGMLTFDQAGLACLGEWVGKERNWFSWLNYNCNKRYSSGDAYRHVFLRAKF